MGLHPRQHTCLHERLGLHTWYFDYSDKLFKEFLDLPATKANPKAEYLIPWVVDKLIKSGKAYLPGPRHHLQVVRCHLFR